MTALTRRSLLLGAGAALLLPLAGCRAAPPGPALTMGCGEEGGIYLQFGELLRDALRDRGAADLTALATHGSADNVERLAAGGVDIATVLADSDTTGFVALGRIYQNYLQCIVRADGPVRTLDDLAGRPVSIGAPGSGASATTRRLLDALDLAQGPRAVLMTELLLGEAVAAVESGEIAAFFWSSGVPTPPIEELSARTPVRVIDTSTVVSALGRSYPNVYVETAIPRGVYGSLRWTPTLGVPNLLLARPDLDDAIVETLVDTLIEDARRLIPPGSVGVQYLTPSNLIDTSPTPLHPAAERRYRQRYG